MTDTLFALVPVHGLWLVLVATFLSCLALPVPSSLIMLGAGAFAAAGDLSLPGCAGSALTGAIAGDQAGFAIGRRGGTPLVSRLRQRPRAAPLIHRAETMLHRRGAVTVFLTRWLFSPLGPWVNFIGGAMALRWRAFTLGSLTGETVWVALYVGLGYVFADSIRQIAEMVSDVSGFLLALAATFVLGRMLFRKRAGREPPLR